MIDFLRSRGVDFTTWEGWHRLDAHEKALGQSQGRERVKVVDRVAMLDASASDRATERNPR